MRAFRSLVYRCTRGITIAALVPAIVFAGEGRASAQTDEERALVLFQAAQLRYEEGRFEEAVQLLEEARSLADEPAITYNMGRALEELGRNDEAAVAYRRYLGLEPNARDRRAIEARIARLESTTETVEPPDEQPPDEQRSDEQTADRHAPDEHTSGDASAHPPRGGALPARTTTDHGVDDAGIGTAGIVGIELAGAGVLALGVGLVVGAIAQGTRDRADDDPVHRSARETFRTAETEATTANVLLAVGGGLALVGALLVVINLATGDGSDVELALGPASLAVAGRWP